MTEEPIELVRGSGNVFRDADLPKPDELQAKANIGAEILGILNERKISATEAGKITGAGQADISRIRNADLAKFTIDRLIRILRKLDPDVHVDVTVTRSSSSAEMHAAR